MKILIMMTGGTISTTVNKNGNLSADGHKTVSLLAENYLNKRCKNSKKVEFEYLHPLDILSENMTFARLNKLMSAFKETDLSKYGGIVVAHGTDTLAYTSTLLALTLAGVTDKPIFMVSADKTLTDEGSNGFDNFAAACELIIGGFDAGVYVPYRNSDGVVYLHHGAHLRQCANFTSDFYSHDMVPYKEAKPYRIAVEHSALQMLRKLQNCVMRIDPFVGLDYSVFRFGENIRAVLHTSYHSATACAERSGEGEAYSSSSLLYLLRECKRNKTDLFLSPLTEDMRVSSGTYSSTADLIKSGVIPVYSLTNEAAYIKLALAYSLGYEGDEVAYFLDRDICGEHLSL